MAFVEVIGFEVDQEKRTRVSRELTDRLTRILNVSSDTISIYYIHVSPTEYAHAGSLASTARRRFFIKVHLLARPEAVLRTAADSIAEVVAKGFQREPRDIAVYFLSRQPGEVAHGGLLESDRDPVLN
jgi:phenylpyruvate tautomerase PptA (4-oxalocrotonate tautomerase family)